MDHTNKVFALKNEVIPDEIDNRLKSILRNRIDLDQIYPPIPKFKDWENIWWIRYTNWLQSIIIPIEIPSSYEGKPVITGTSMPSVWPGAEIYIYGKNLSKNSGEKKVLLSLGNDSYTNLEILSWSDTEVKAKVDQNISSVHQCDSKLWIKYNDGSSTNAFSIRFFPIYSLYFYQTTKKVSRGFSIKPTREKKQGIICDGINLDEGFAIIHYDEFSCNEHDLTSINPFPNGRSLAHGYKLFLYPFQSCHFTAVYQVVGPKGIRPSTIPDVYITLIEENYNY